MKTSNKDMAVTFSYSLWRRHCFGPLVGVFGRLGITSTQTSKTPVFLFPRKAAALEIRTDRGGLSLINVHGPQAGCSPWAARMAFWADIQTYATARSLGGWQPVVIAGDTNIYMDSTTNAATEHFRAGWEAGGFRRAMAGGVEDMNPMLQPSPHRVDTFLVNEPLLLWSLRESVWVRGMAHPQVIGSDDLPVRRPCRASSTRRAMQRCPPPTATQRAASYGTTPRLRSSSASCGRRSPPRRTRPPWRPDWAPLSSMPTGPCPRQLQTRCLNTSTRRIRLTAQGGAPTAVPDAIGPGGRRPPREREAAAGGDPPLRHPGSMRAGGVPGKRGQTWHPLRGSAPTHGGAAGCIAGFRPATQGQLQEELERQTAALEEDVRQLPALLAADRKRAIKDFWRRHTQDIAHRWKAV